MPRGKDEPRQPSAVSVNLASENRSPSDGGSRRRPVGIDPRTIKRQEINYIWLALASLAFALVGGSCGNRSPSDPVSIESQSCVRVLVLV